MKAYSIDLRERVAAACQQGGCTIGEVAFSKLKTWLRTAQARTREALESVIQTATDWITEQDAKNWFDHCSYHVH